MKLPVNITFLDLQNAFCAIFHNLIIDMLDFANVPHLVINYVKDCYSSL